MHNSTKELNNINIMPIVRYKGYILPELYVSILALVGDGYSNIEIAEELGFAKRTVEGLIAKIRDLVVALTGERLTERGLVIFGREMLDGYKSYLKLCKTPKLSQAQYRDIELIEDWDDEDDDDFTGLDTEIYLPQTPKQPQDKIVDLKQYRHDYEITNFEAEERELLYSNGTHYLV